MGEMKKMLLLLTQQLEEKSDKKDNKKVSFDTIQKLENNSKESKKNRF